MTDRDYTRLVQAIEEQLQQKGRLIVAIDGRCGSGKSTLAARLARELRCSVFHMDDFFPRPEQRTAERLSQPGENVDHERFLAEVLLPLHNAQPVTYRPYLCARQQLGAPRDRPANAPDHGGGLLRLPSHLAGILRPAGVPNRCAGGAAAAHRKPQRPGEGADVP